MTVLPRMASMHLHAYASPTLLHQHPQAALTHDFDT
jgi:hypothetical protein